MSNFLVRGGAPVIERALTEHWGEQDIRRFQANDSSGKVDIGVRAIDALVSVHGNARGGHVVTVSHDKDFAGDVRAFVKAVGAARRA